MEVTKLSELPKSATDAPERPTPAMAKALIWAWFRKLKTRELPIVMESKEKPIASCACRTEAGTVTAFAGLAWTEVPVGHAA